LAAVANGNDCGAFAYEGQGRPVRHKEVSGVVKRALIGLFLVALCAPAFLPAGAQAAGESDLITLAQDVQSASGYRYGARDDRGNSLDTLKIVNNPNGGYLGVYHTTLSGEYYVKVATSTDLLNWKTRTVLASHGSQPTIARLTDGGFLVAYEADADCIGAGAPLGSPAGNCLRFLHYPSVTALLTRRADRSLQVKRTLSRCAEGTPNIFAAHLNPDIAHSTIRVGLHYFRNCTVDRQAIGTLTNFSAWKAEVPQAPNATVQALGALGNIGDRDSINFDGVMYRLVEGQLTNGDFSSWRTFLYSQLFGAKMLNIHTHRGSTAFANPTATWVNAPGGGKAIVFTQFIPLGGAKSGEAGELIYYKRLPATDPVIAAAGDIACDPASSSFNGGLGTATSCRQKYTADLLTSMPLSGVLTLGDNQYEQGQLSQYLGSYDATWGRFKYMTYPAVGNHEYMTSGALGYFDYFNGAGIADGLAGQRGKGYYSFDIGSWHLVALNSNCASAGGCSVGSPQELWLRTDLATHPTSCTLAYWHHPRFSSGSTHGDNASVAPLWQDLYDANADLVLVGHDHLYERFAPQTSTGVADPVRGVREFVVGTGGRSHYSFNTPEPNSEVRNSDTFGVLELTLHSSSYDWSFVPEAGRTFTDTGSAACH
jgi:acid phosphatase type 7